jgi:hypothetical protein
VIYPEDFPLPEQAAMFRHADVVAGYAGSALFTLAFCETPKLVIMISPEIFKPRNEYMICSVLGHQLNVLWCKPDAVQAGNTQPLSGHESSFTFDFACRATQSIAGGRAGQAADKGADHHGYVVARHSRCADTGAFAPEAQHDHIGFLMPGHPDPTAAPAGVGHYLTMGGQRQHVG